MKFFTAEEARKLAGKPVDQKIKDLLKTVEQIASNGGHICRCSYNHKIDNDLWVDSGYIKTEDWKEACIKLRNLGFTVDFYYADDSFAVDMYTVVKW